jgi:signal transduction histidine kinase
MKTPFEIILVLSFFITLIMTSVTYLSWRKDRKKELLHQTNLWASLAANALIYFFLRTGSALEIGISMVGWIWVIKTISDTVSDLSGRALFKRWEYFVMIGAGFLSLALGGYHFNFITFTAPFSVAIGCLGLYEIFSVYHESPHVKRTAFYTGSMLFVGLLFIERLTFPLWRLSEYSETGVILFLISCAGLSSLLIAGIFENATIAQTISTEQLMKDRNEKLLGQSKYSELGMMSAGIAHEINNPLAVIQARTTQLLRIYRNPERQQDLADGLQQILYTSERINRTIQGVREFVHQDEQSPMVKIDLKILFDDVLAFCGQRMKNHGVNLRFYGLETFSVIGNKIQLEQIILNLLNNSFDAIEYLPEKWIEVSAHPNGPHIRLYFKDSGNGIPREIASRIMEPFFSTKDIGKGTGLGLALARGIAEKHGGSLQYLYDCPHTTFMLELPENAEIEWGNSLH